MNQENEQYVLASEKSSHTMSIPIVLLQAIDALIYDLRSQVGERTSRQELTACLLNAALNKDKTHLIEQLREFRTKRVSDILAHLLIERPYYHRVGRPHKNSSQ